MMRSTRSFTTVARYARVWWERLRAGTTEVTATTEDEPLRAELFSADQMALYGKRLAAARNAILWSRATASCSLALP